MKDPSTSTLITRDDIQENMTDNFLHIYKKGQKKTTFCLFHGTGGDENDLIPIAELIDKHANIISLRGNSNENGMNRFFKRMSEGVFDEEDIILQSGNIVAFLKKAEKDYGFDLKKTIFLGYSNGANIATSILFLHPKIVYNAILFRPMTPLIPNIKPDLRDHSILITAGTNDPIVSIEDSEKLVQLYTSYNADVETTLLPAGHRLTEKDVITALHWYKNKLSQRSKY